MVDSAAFRGVMAINNCCMNEAKSGQDIEANDCQRTQITEHAKCGWERGWGGCAFSTSFQHPNAENCAIKNNAWAGNFTPMASRM